MSLSIIIPVLDDADALQRLLACLNGMERSDVEIIVVDGGSHDRSLAVAEAGANRVLNCSPGRAYQMNAGAQVASGDLLWFLHADASVSAALLQTVARLRPTPRLWGRCDVRFDARPPVFRVIAAFMNVRSRLTGIATGDQGIFVSRELFAREGGYAALPLMEDVELCSRLRRTAPPLCLRERLGADARRWQRHGIVRTILLMWWLRLRFFFGADPYALHARYYGARP